MSKEQEPLETLREIRSLMERSSRFTSLSGFTGAIAGVAALLGVLLACLFWDISPFEPGYYRLATQSNGEPNTTFYTFMAVDGLIVLAVSLLAVTLLSIKNARQNKQPIWDANVKRLLINLAIPLVAGGLYCLILLRHNQMAFILPGTLLFYGLAMVNASKYTLNDIRSLGIVQIVLGLFASVFIEYGLLFWALGFGIIHIVYGITLYLKYDT